FDRMAEKIEETERRALAAAEVTESLRGDSLEAEFQKLKPASEAVEDRLLQLKERMGILGPGTAERAALQSGEDRSGNGGSQDVGKGAEIEEEAERRTRPAEDSRPPLRAGQRV